MIAYKTGEVTSTEHKVMKSILSVLLTTDGTLCANSNIASYQTFDYMVYFELVNLLGSI